MDALARSTIDRRVSEAREAGTFVSVGYAARQVLMELERDVARLEAKRDDLEYQCRLLAEERDALGGSLWHKIPVPEWKITPTQGAILRYLVMGHTLRRSKFIALAYSGAGCDEPDHKILDVFVCHIRRKLRGRGLPGPKNIWGHGYAFEPADAGVVFEALRALPSQGVFLPYDLTALRGRP
jgi:hypothetical protein